MLEVQGYSDFKTEFVTMISRSYWELLFCILRTGCSFTLGHQWLSSCNQYHHCAAFLEIVSVIHW